MSDIKMIPVDEIHVLNPRARSKAKFGEIVGNISRVGLKRPITVTPRAGGGYNLACGQGRLEAFITLKQTHVPAVVQEMSKEDLYVRSIVENLARGRPAALALANEIMALKQRGNSPAEIAAKVDVTEGYVRGVQRLFQQGEERLLVAVTRGEIPVSVAIEIASSSDAGIQNALAEAYEKGELRGKALLKARSLTEERRARGKTFDSRHATAPSKKRTTADELVRAYRRETQRQESLVRKARSCERQLAIVAAALRELFKDEGFVNLLRAEKLGSMPKYVAQQIRRKAS